MNRKMTQSVYKKKLYPSQCAYYKVMGYCKYSWYQKTSCKKTCTGSGSNKASYSKPYNGTVYSTTKYTSRCAWYKIKGWCKRSWYKSSCAKTCTGKGTDKRSYAKPYEAREPILLRTVTYKTHCDFYKAKGSCKYSWAKKSCAKTCGACAK